MFDPWADKIVVDLLAKEKLHLGEDEIKALLSPDKFLFVQKEENELHKIASLPAEQREKALVRHQKKYFWLNSDWANVIVLGVDYFRKRLDSAREQKIAKRLKYQRRLPKSAQSLFYFFRQMTHWRDERKRAALINNNYYYAFFKEFARRTGVSYNAISFASPAEIIASKLKFTTAFKKHLESRTEKCAFYWDKQEHSEAVLIKEDYDKFMSVLDTAFTGRFKELKGAPASRGIAEGIVRIINTPEDFMKMRKGDILVAPMTRPEYLPLMKIAGAIVTDEGGVTCHAAIVSRELGLPCIIGTQVATEVLKDGDVVEVDANLGVVRKI